MVVSSPAASQLDSKRAALRQFVARPGTQLVAVGIAAVASARVVVGGWGPADVVVVAVLVALVGPTEWLIHRGLFHAPLGSRRARSLRSGERHGRHHDRPTDLEWLLLDRRGMTLLMAATAILASAIAAALAAVIAATATALGLESPPIGGPSLTGVVLAWLALANYEWTHLLIHSHYRARTKRYRRLARNHLAHHHRDETTWLGVTTNLGDRLFRSATD